MSTAALQLPTSYTYSNIGTNWSFVSQNKKEFLDFEVNHPVLLSELLANVSESNKQTFAYRNMERDLVVDCDIDRQRAISLAARRIVVLHTGSLAAPYLRTESKNPVLCLGALKYNEHGSNQGWIGPYRGMVYSGLHQSTGVTFACSEEWNAAIKQAHHDAGVNLDMAKAAKEEQEEYDRAVQEYYARTAKSDQKE